MRKKKAPDSAYALQDAFIHGHPNRHWFVARTFIHLISNANGMPAIGNSALAGFFPTLAGFSPKSAPPAGKECPSIVHLLLWY
ncbi:hypothetical protein ACJV2S_17965 [Klebsiella pneumoniae]